MAFGKKKSSQNLDEQVAMKIFVQGKVHDVSYRELLLSTNLTLEALLLVLTRKNLITSDELLEAIQEIRTRKTDQNTHSDSGETSGDFNGK